VNGEKIRYSILKEIDNGNRPLHIEYEITQNEFCDIIQNFIDEGLLTNAKVERMGSNKRVALIKGSRVTTEGKEYLNKNTTWSKAYSLAKEIRDWVK
jgi:predicted transglutaminase-like protease